MRNIKILFYLLAVIVFSSCSDDEDCPKTVEGDAVYKISFILNWNSTDFPIDYPSNAHFSPLIGWSHQANNDFFKLGSIASPGIVSMAETGATSILKSELEARIEKGEGLDMIIGKGLSTGSGEISVNISLTAKNSAVTFATMVAPSPDWYVAVVNVNLLENGAFVDTKTIIANVYDAGSDAGLSFKSANLPVSPKEGISIFVDSPLGDGTKLSAVFATVKFTKQ